jgi:hypothetical protein
MVSLRLDSGKLCGAPWLRAIHRSELLPHDHAQFPAPALDGKGQPLLGAIGNRQDAAREVKLIRLHS